MGVRIVDGVVQRGDQPTAKDGEFTRRATVFRHAVVANEGQNQDREQPRFVAAAGRYRLFVSYACPWAHRTIIARKLLGLESAIPMFVTSPYNQVEGWSFEHDAPDVSEGPEGLHWLHELYTRSDPKFTGRITVPLLWDTVEETIVNNESEEIIRMFDGPFREFGSGGPNLYPQEHRDAIHAINEPVYETVNNGVYRAGFARSQERHDVAVAEIFDTLDMLEKRLTSARWLVANRFTESDLRLFTTLVRFDPVYNVHFKCSRRRVIDYPALWGFVRDVAQIPGVMETISMEHIRGHYYRCHTSVNPRQLIAAMPDGFDLTLSHEREGLGPDALADV